MSGSSVIFYILAISTLVCAFLAVTSRQIFRSAIYLLFALVGIAGIYFWLDYQFIAAVQVIVYVGGIVVLIIFSIFLTQQAGESLATPAPSRKLISGITVVAAFAISVVLIYRYSFSELRPKPGPGVEEIGRQMLSTARDGFALPFEIVSILLLAALIGCIVIAAPARLGKQDTVKDDPVKKM